MVNSMIFRTAEFRTQASGSFRNIRRSWLRRALPIVLVSATVLAVTGGPGLVRAAATNSRPAPQPAVRVVLPSLNFGSTIIGKRVSQTVSVANPENSFVNISQPNVSISRISLSGLALPFSLPVEQSGRFQDRFDATSTGNATGTVPIETYSGISLEPLAPPPVAPTITMQPGNQSVTAGQTATFTVAATGTTPMTYQWQKNGSAISGATSSAYTTPVTTTSDNAAQFNVVVTNSAGSATSSAAILAVTSKSYTLITVPSSLSFSWQVGSPAPVAQIIKVMDNSPNCEPITITTNQSWLTVSPGSACTAPLMLSVSVNTAGLTTGSSSGNVIVNGPTELNSPFAISVTLTVSSGAIAPSITTQPANETVTAGQTATFTMVAGGTAPLGYQWRKNAVNISGATSASYTTPATAATDSGSTFSVAVSNTAGTVTSAAATLTVNPAPVAPTITTPPASQTVTAGQTATFTVLAAGIAPLGYQWQKNAVNISGATSASYTTPATAATDSGSTFDVVVSNTAGSVTSTMATLTVSAAPVAGIQLSSNPINFGNDVVGSNSTQLLIITNTGTATLTITQVNESGSAFSTSGFSLPFSVNAGKGTTMTVAFLPTAVGAASGSISIVSNAPASPTSVSLTGTGIAATFTLGISPASLSFGNVTTGTSSASQNVTITDTGNANVTISQITLNGSAYSMTGGSAPVTLTPSQNLILASQFDPTVTGSVSGSISMVSNATGSPATVSLSGTGVVPVQHSVALTWSASTSTVSGYNVYRGTVSGGPYTKINSSLVAILTYTDSTVQSGTTYYYVTTAVDSSGDESVYSNGASAPIP